MENYDDTHHYKNLAYKVMNTALFDLSRQRDKNFYRALDWIADRKSATHLPFETICHGLDFDPDAIREGIVQNKNISRLFTEEEKRYLLKGD